MGDLNRQMKISSKLLGKYEPFCAYDQVNYQSVCTHTPHTHTRVGQCPLNWQLTMFTVNVYSKTAQYATGT